MKKKHSFQREFVILGREGKDLCPMYSVRSDGKIFSLNSNDDGSVSSEFIFTDKQISLKLCNLLFDILKNEVFLAK